MRIWKYKPEWERKSRRRFETKLLEKANRDIEWANECYKRAYEASFTIAKLTTEIYFLKRKVEELERRVIE